MLQVISARPNISKLLHLPAQSGSSAVLQRMRRGYSREAYLELVGRVREAVPGGERTVIGDMFDSGPGCTALLST